MLSRVVFLASPGRAKSLARWVVWAAVFGGLLVPTVPVPASAAITPSWLVRLNNWRATSGVSALSENTAWDQDDYNHSYYMVKTGLVTHYEDPANPYYTASGDAGARNGNIQVSSTTATSDDSAIDWWMAAPFHAMGMMDPRLTSTGYGSYREVNTGWQTGMTLDVLRGNSWTGGSYPVYFPGNGSVVPLTTFHGNETPDPLQACPGYVAPTGLPAFIEVGGNVNTQVTAHSFTGNGVALAHCVIDSTNPTFTNNLKSRGGVIVIPQAPLAQGIHYVVNLTVNGVPYTWSFGVSNTGSFTPGAPTITNVVAGDSSATLNWSPPSSTGGTPIVSYTVTSYTGNVAQSTQTIPATGNSATFTGLTNGTTYTFSVAATNAAGTGPAAMSYSVTPSSSAVPPARMTALSTSQYRLPNSDGVTWQDMDANNLSLSVTPAVSSVAIISGNADLWTASAGVNQDFGIWMSSTLNPPSVVAWKESGGFAGTYSPNAAVVQAVLPLTANVTYSLKLDWKTNKPAIGASIFAGAGPIGGQFSPTRLSVVLVPTANLSTAVTTIQYQFANSDGATWQAMDATNLQTTLTATANGTALVSVNSDLWTANAGFNQDIAIFVSVNAAADQLVGWKESGGFAGTYSPNAAFVQATWPVSIGNSYVFKVKWKANKNAAGATIFAGAGPIAGNYSPTRLTAIFEPAGSLATTSTNSQYHLAGNNGSTWQAVDSARLQMLFTPGTTANYVVSANADLWTANAGFNQDFAIFISGGSFATPTLLGWKESGGYAGTFSPNAAYAETVVSLQSGTQYTIWLAWKTNANAGGATIFAAAGPLAGGLYSPTRLTVIPQQ